MLFQKGQGYWLNKKRSKETKRKISKSLKERYIKYPELKKQISERLKGNTNGFQKGHQSSEKQRKRTSERYKKNNPMWRLEARKKISMARKDKKHSEKTKQKISKTLTGRKLSEETKRKIGEAEKGEKNLSWQGGISFEPYGLEFNNQLKESIRQWNNYRCQECFRHQDELYSKNGRKYKLIVHHIDYNKKNNNPDNLISLCRNCHSQTNFKREDWTNYFKII